jgi:hypothetical protein
LQNQKYRDTRSLLAPQRRAEGEEVQLEAARSQRL